jgi:hypothetical protein
MAACTSGSILASWRSSRWRSPGESYSDVIADWPRTLRNPAVERSRRNRKRPPLADIPASALLVIYATPKESAECPQA